MFVIYIDINNQVIASADLLLNVVVNDIMDEDVEYTPALNDKAKGIYFIYHLLYIFDIKI